MIGARKRRGFTLIELLVVASVFSLLFLIGATVFTNIQTFQRGILARQRVTADGRYVLESIARDIRLNAIDYSYYRDPDGDGDFSDQIDLTNPQQVLAVRDPSDVKRCYRLNAGAIEVGTDCTTGTILTPSDLDVTGFAVRIHPRSNPYLPPPTAAADCSSGATFDGALEVCQCAVDADCFDDQTCVAAAGASICQNATRQPHVTVTVETESTNTGPGERADVRLQTTVSSRAYGI